MRNSIFVCLAVTFLLPRVVFGWGAAGHQLLAYRALPPKFQAEEIEVLKAHPDFAKWQAAYHPNAVFDVYAYALMRSSTWLDEIHRSGSIYDQPKERSGLKS